MENKNNLIVVKNLNDPTPANEPHRLLCMTGQHKGQSYFLTGKRIILGRGDNADIQVLDSKSSRHHCELSKIQDEYVLTDLQSQNGTLVNGKKIKQYTLENNDKIIIGATVFKYTYKIVNDVFGGKKSNSETEASNTKPSNLPPAKDKKKNKMKTILMSLLLVFGILTFFDEQAPQESRKLAAPKLQKQDSLLGTKMSKNNAQEEADDVLSAHIHRGQREYREGNYLRALEEFRMARIISPGHSQASYYEKKTQQALDNQISAIFVKATRESDALSYEAAAHSYCSILRLIQSFPDDNRYKQALGKKHDMEKQLGLDKDEIKCLQK